MNTYQPEGLYRQLVEHMNEAVWLCDSSDRTIYVNPKFTEMTGYTEDEVMGKIAMEFCDTETVERIKKATEAFRSKGLSNTYEAKIRTKSGEYIPVLINGTPLPDGGSIGIMTDLGELKRRESIYQGLVENMNEAVWMGDKNERTIYANPKFCTMLGYTLEEILGRESYDFWEPESAERVRNANMSDRKQGRASSYEGNLMTKDGHKIPVLLSGTPLPNGGTIGIMTDLTDLKRREFKEKMLSRAIGYASDIILIIDSEGKIFSWNRGAKLAFGHRSEEIVGQSITKIFGALDFTAWCKSGHVYENLELHATHKNGESVTVAATLTPIDPGASDEKFCLLIARDITHQQKVEEEIAVKYQKLREAYNQFGVIRRQMDYIFELLDIALEDGRQQSIGDFLVNSVIMLTRVDACALRMYDPKKNVLHLLSSFGLSSAWKGRPTIKYSGSIGEKAFKQRTPLKIVDVMKDPKYGSKALAKTSNFTSLLLIPLIHGDTLLGTLTLYASPEKKLEIFENEFIEQYAKLASLVLAKGALS